MRDQSQGNTDPVRRFAAGVSLLVLAMAPAVARAGDDTTPEAVPPIEVKADKMPVPIGEPADAEGHADYLVTRSRTGSKTDTPNNKVPQHVTVVPNKVIEEQNDRSVQETLKNVAGVVNTYPQYFPLDYWSNSYIRGFPVSMTLVDGLWDPTPQGNSWMGNVERVDMLKGPSGLLYGAYSGGIGGVINVVSKRPKQAPAITASTAFDSWGSKSLTVDASTPIFGNPNWLVRAIGSTGELKSFYDHSSQKKSNFQIAVDGRPTDDDAIALTYEYRWQKAFPYSGQPGYGVIGSGTSAYLKSFGSFDQSLNVYDPRSYWTYQSNTLRASWEHRFNEDWSFKTSNQFTVTQRDAYSISATPSFVSGLPKYTQSAQDILMGPVYGYDTDNMVHGHFDTFGLKHDFIVGERYAAVDYNMNMGRPTPYVFGTYSFTDPNNPNWGQSIANTKQYMYGYSKTYQYGTYVNDTISITDRLRVVGGFNWIDYSTYSRSGMNPASLGSSSTSGSGAAWRVGALYDVVPGVTPFVDYSTTFKPQGTNTTTDGTIQTFDPLTGNQIEAGVKVELADRASITASLYQIEMMNVTQADPNPARGTLGYLVQTGKQRSRGFEIDASYKILPGWNALLAYAYTDAVYVSDGTYLPGSGVPNVPRNALRLWTHYDVQDGTFKGLGVGAGMTATAARQAALITQAMPNVDLRLPGYATFDAAASYQWKNAKLSLNVKNIFDHKYWEGSNGYTWLYQGEPLNASLRLDVTF